MGVTPSSTFEDYRISSDFVRLLFDYLDRRGVDAPDLLGVPRPPRSELGVTSYSMDDWTALLERAQRRLDDAALGLHLGQAATVAHFGLFGYLLVSCNSFGDALLRGARYWRLLRPHVKVRTSAQADSVCIAWDTGQKPLSGISDEASLTGLLCLARIATGQPLRALEAGFAHDAPQDSSAYDEYYGCAVRFGQPVVSIRFPLSCLRLPLRDADPELRTLLENQAESLLAIVPDDDESLEQTVRRCIARAMRAAEPTVEQVAELLHLSPRTLQRRLDENQLNFRALLDDTRRQLAESYLLDPAMQLKEVAQLLGFSEQSAFTRAFKRWTGQSPREYIKSREEADPPPRESPRA